MATSYKRKIYTTLGTPTQITSALTPSSISDSSGVPVKDYTVKGKSIVWNQLIKNGNFVDTTGWSVYNGTSSVSNNKYTFTVSGTETYASVLQYMDKSVFIAGHKYYVTATITPQYSTGKLAVAAHNGASVQQEIWSANAASGKTNSISTTFTISSDFVSGATAGTRFIFYCPQTQSAQGDVTVISNTWMVDLTRMFGAGNEPNSAQFRTMFPEDYYDYDAGTVKNISGGQLQAQNSNQEIKAINLPVETYFPDGFNSIGNVYDEISFSAQTATKRIGVRPYQDGDENNSAVLTDKTNTLYALSTPVVTNTTQKLQALPTYKGFNSFSFPNNLMQNGPFSLTYYAEGGENPEKGWLTSYKRKIAISVPDIQNTQKRDNYPIKGQFTTMRGSESLTWDVLDYDKHELVDTDTTKTMCVGMHNIFIYGTMPFCASQLMYWSENGLPAGTYKLTLDHAQYGGGTVYDGTYMFTLTKAIPADGGFRHTKPVGGWQSSYAKADILGNYITTYGARPQRSAIESRVTFSEYDGTTECTDLGTFTARSRTYYTEDDTVNGGKRNFTERQAYGSNRWRDSVYRQWLNSTAPAGTTGNGVSNWWTPQSVFDRAPGGANSAGFLYGLDPSFVAAMGKVKVITALCDCDKADGATQDITYDKVWLQSMTEVFGNANNSISEGVRLAYWNGSTDADRIKYHNGTARYWWLRSPNPADASYVRYVTSSGALISHGASNADGVVPACCIKQYDGGKTIEFNQRADFGTLYGVDSNYQISETFKSSDSVIAGNKYFFYADVVSIGGNSTLGIWWRNADNEAVRWCNRNAISVAPATLVGGGTTQQNFWMYGSRTLSATNIMLFDLTAMFGAGNEPSTPAEFWQYFDNKYYPYNTGETQQLFLQSRKAKTEYTIVNTQNKFIFDKPDGAKSATILGWGGQSRISNGHTYDGGVTAVRVEGENLIVPLSDEVTRSSDSVTAIASTSNINSIIDNKKDSVLDGHFVASSENAEFNSTSSNDKAVSTTVVIRTPSSDVWSLGVRADGPRRIAGTQNEVNVFAPDLKIPEGAINAVAPYRYYVQGLTGGTITAKDFAIYENKAAYAIPTEVTSLTGYGMGIGDLYNSVERHESGDNFYELSSPTYIDARTTDKVLWQGSITGALEFTWAGSVSTSSTAALFLVAVDGENKYIFGDPSPSAIKHSLKVSGNITKIAMVNWCKTTGTIASAKLSWQTSGWHYVQRVGNITFTQELLETASETGTTIIDGKTVAWARNIQFPDNAIKYTYHGTNGWANMSILGDVVFNGTKYISTQYKMYFMNYSSIDDVKTALGTNGVYFHYELAKPIITDISDKIDSSFLKDIPLSGGKKLVMYNGRCFDIPSTVKWSF